MVLRSQTLCSLEHCLFAGAKSGVVREIFESLEYGPAPESPAVANAWLDDHGRNFGHFINNQWVKPTGRKSYDTFNPATGEKLASTTQGEIMISYLTLIGALTGSSTVSLA